MTMPKVQRKMNYKKMIDALRQLRRDWQRTFAGLQKKQNTIIKTIVAQEESKKLSSLRRSLS